MWNLKIRSQLLLFCFPRFYKQSSWGKKAPINMEAHTFPRRKEKAANESSSLALQQLTTVLWRTEDGRIVISWQKKGRGKRWESKKWLLKNCSFSSLPVKVIGLRLLLARFNYFDHIISLRKEEFWEILRKDRLLDSIQLVLFIPQYL